jgi:hypothetical protein
MLIFTQGICPVCVSFILLRDGLCTLHCISEEEANGAPVKYRNDQQRPAVQQSNFTRSKLNSLHNCCQKRRCNTRYAWGYRILNFIVYRSLYCIGKYRATSYHVAHFPVFFIFLVYCSRSGRVLFFANVKTYGTVRTFVIATLNKAGRPKDGQ